MILHRKFTIKLAFLNLKLMLYYYFKLIAYITTI